MRTEQSSLKLLDVSSEKVQTFRKATPLASHIMVSTHCLCETCFRTLIDHQGGLLCCRAASRMQAELAASSFSIGQQKPRCQSELAGSGIFGLLLQPVLGSNAAGARLPLALDVLFEAKDSTSPSAARAAFLLSPSWHLMGLDESLQAHQLAGAQLLYAAMRRLPRLSPLMP